MKRLWTAMLPGLFFAGIMLTVAAVTASPGERGVISDEEGSSVLGGFQADTCAKYALKSKACGTGSYTCPNQPDSQPCPESGSYESDNNGTKGQRSPSQNITCTVCGKTCGTAGYYLVFAPGCSQ